MQYPRPVTRIHQIEITSRCNLRCQYCVHPSMARTKQDMSLETFEKALELVKDCEERFDQDELNLAGIGESTMHPEFPLFVKLARVMLPDMFIAIATNGLLLDERMAAMLLEHKVATWISLHRPEKAGIAVEIAKRYKILKGVSNDPALASINWAGKVDWHVSAPTDRLCPWLTQGRAMVCSDGRITTCCLDGEGDGIIGHVTTNSIDTLSVAPYSLCKSCHHTIPEETSVEAVA